jgi:hypothetical protein
LRARGPRSNKPLKTPRPPASRRADLWAGLLFAAFGVGALAAGRGLPVGTAAQMGPGYFPMLLGAVLIVLGVALAARGLSRAGRAVGPLALRPLGLVTAALLAFGLLLRPLGLALATAGLVLIARLGDRESRGLETALLAAVLALLAAAVFVYGLRLPLPLWPE